MGGLEAYLATVINLASREVVGRARDDHMRTDLVFDPLTMAFITRHPPKGTIVHSDRRFVLGRVVP